MSGATCGKAVPDIASLIRATVRRLSKICGAVAGIAGPIAWQDLLAHISVE
jgi:hypothetical protein